MRFDTKFFGLLQKEGYLLNFVRTRRCTRVNFRPLPFKFNFKRLTTPSQLVFGKVFRGEVVTTSKRGYNFVSLDDGERGIRLYKIFRLFYFDMLFVKRISLVGVGFKFWSVGKSSILFDLGINRFFFFKFPPPVRLIYCSRSSFLIASNSRDPLSVVAVQLCRLIPFSSYSKKGVFSTGSKPRFFKKKHNEKRL